MKYPVHPLVAFAEPPVLERVNSRHGGAEMAQTETYGWHASWFILLMVAAAGVPQLARAHDAFEIWTIAVLRADHLELGVTMAQSTALRLIDPQMKAGAITTENFALHRPRLEQEAARLCILTADRKPLATRKIEVELTDENDIAFRIAYPRPAPGRLHFHAACLKKLGAGYGGILDASESSGHHLGWEQLSSENPNFEVTIPAPSSPAK
jgi:hypothetical protein